MNIRDIITAAWDMLNEDPLRCIVAICAVGMGLYLAHTIATNLP